MKKKSFSVKQRFNCKKSLLIMQCIIIALSMCSCKKTPQESIVKEKDFNKMIDQAQNGNAGTKDISSMNYDTYTVDINDENLNVKVSGEAKVDIPQTDKMSVIKVKQKDISQDMIEQLIEIVAPDEKLYDGAVTQVQLKSDIESEIRAWKEEITNLRNEMNQAPEDEREYLQSNINEYQSYIDEYQELYNNAPADVPWESYLSDKKITSVRELYNKNPEGEFIQWEYSLNETGDVFYAVNDGSGGEYLSIFAQNNKSYGNCLRYRKSKNGYIATYLASVGIDVDGSLERWNVSEGLSHSFLKIFTDNGLSGDDLKEYTNEPVTKSEDEARKQADEFVHKMELGDYDFYTGELCYEIPDIRFYPDGSKVSNEYPYRKIYVFTYLRNINGALVNNLAADKAKIVNYDGSFVKQFWPGESLVVYVNDDGVVGMDLNAPIEISDTVVEDSNLKDFDEIKDTFEQMVVVGNAQEENVIQIELDRVTLSYTRISAKDNFLEGYLVPIWDFRGKLMSGSDDGKDDIQFLQDDRSILAINAIDGTVIDRELGY